jgi:predicted O-methyltransferase YrrM
MEFNIKHKPTIQSSREEVLVKLLNEKGSKVGVEVGVFKGEFSKTLLSGWNGRLYMVDPWRGLGGDYIDKTNHKHHSSIFQDAMESIEGYENRAIMVRALSEEAIDLFEDNSLDFVYIDGNHGYNHVKLDLELWWPKLKSGGIMSGHDFIMVDWNKVPKQAHGKNTHVYSQGTKYELKGHYTTDSEIPHGGIFGVNPAVHEFSLKHGVDYDLTKEWASTFIMIKP